MTPENGLLLVCLCRAIHQNPQLKQRWESEEIPWGQSTHTVWAQMTRGDWQVNQLTTWLSLTPQNFAHGVIQLADRYEPTLEGTPFRDLVAFVATLTGLPFWALKGFKKTVEVSLMTRMYSRTHTPIPVGFEMFV